MPQLVADGDLYERDFYAWTAEQTRKLRRLRQQGANVDLDLLHLIEEVAALGRVERVAVHSQSGGIIEHRLKLEYSRDAHPRHKWHESIGDARREIEFKLTPMLRRNPDPRIGRIYRRARSAASQRLHLYGETEAAAMLPVQCPYAGADLLRDGRHPASRHGFRP